MSAVGRQIEGLFTTQTGHPTAESGRREAVARLGFSRPAQTAFLRLGQPLRELRRLKSVMEIGKPE
jgi:hypothetical protein